MKIPKVNFLNFTPAEYKKKFIMKKMKIDKVRKVNPSRIMKEGG